jgi:hypothetical protein
MCWNLVDDDFGSTGGTEPRSREKENLRCEVSKRAMHRSSPHGPCEPSARLMGQARTYATDLPKWVSTLPEVALNETYTLPTIRIVSPAIRARSCTIVTPTCTPQSGFSMPPYDTTLCIHVSNEPALLIPHRLHSSLLGIQQQDTTGPLPQHDGWTTSCPFPDN